MDAHSRGTKGQVQVEPSRSILPAKLSRSGAAPRSYGIVGFDLTPSLAQSRLAQPSRLRFTSEV